jgi:serine protease Do
MNLVRNWISVSSLAFSALSAFAQAPPAPPAPPTPPSAAPRARAQARVMTIYGGGSYLGIGVKDVDAERAKALKLPGEYGVEVTSVEEDSPAAKAGLKISDVVLEYNGQRIESTTQFIRMIHETPSGRNAKMAVVRNGGSQNITAVIATRARKTVTIPDMEKIREQVENIDMHIPDIRMMDIPKAMMSWKSSLLGVEAEALETQLAQYFGVEKGVLVRSVAKGSAAEKAGLKAGDVITKVDDTKVTAPRDITTAIRNLKEKQTFAVTYLREKREASAQVTIEPPAASGRKSRPSPVRTVRQFELDLEQ